MNKPVNVTLFDFQEVKSWAVKAQSLGNLSDICFLLNESSGKVNQIKVATAQTKSARG